jgi:succinyl-diaminopimelate desuccinylase
VQAGVVDRVVAEVDRAREELIDLTAQLVRIPTVNPPGEAYDVCAHLVGDYLARQGFDVRYLPAEGRPEHTGRWPRINVLARRDGGRDGRAVHLNGHIDVVPAGHGWTRDPFGAEVHDGRMYGRGTSDMKAGLAAAMVAASALVRADVEGGPIEISGTVDEESGGLAGVAWLAEQGWLSRERTAAVIIPEPFGVDRVCIGHRGVYWFEIEARGRAAHGSMPFLGASAIEGIGVVLQLIRDEWGPSLARRVTAMPVVPEPARHATVNVNSVEGGQPAAAVQTPCVADRCRLIVDRRFLIEEGLEQTRAEIALLVARAQERLPEVTLTLHDRLVVHPTETPDGSPVTRALVVAIERVTGRSAALVASPGTYDHKHDARIAGVPDCVAYGPGELEMAHQPDESVAIEDVVTAAKVIAVATVTLAGEASAAVRPR